MGLFERLFPSKNKIVIKDSGAFKTLTAYQPVFRTRAGGLYEADIVRAAIHARATHMSKLGFKIVGSANPRLQTRLKHTPNEFQTWGQFFYRLSTILDCQSTAFIVPTFDIYGEVVGIYPVLPSRCEIVDYKGTPYLKYKFMTGGDASIELTACSIMTKFQYKDDFFGTDNNALDSTMDLIDIANQGITEGVKSSATYRFAAQVSNWTQDEDLVEERKKFSKENLQADSEAGGILLFPNTYQNIIQLQSKPYTVDAEQMKIIQTNVYDYFGVNEDILQNKAFGQAMDAFFEGAIEPFAMQLADVLSKMFFTPTERSNGNQVFITCNRLQYMTVADKISLATNLGDRGMILIDEVRELFNYPPLPDGAGQVAPVRGEYYMLNDENNQEENDNGENEGNP